MAEPWRTAYCCPGCGSWDECQCELDEDSCCVDEIPCPDAGGIPCAASECVEAGECLEQR